MDADDQQQQNGGDDADDVWQPAANNNDAQQQNDPPVVEALNRNADGSFDGGVAVAPGGDESRSRRNSSECDLILFLECTETIDVAPNHTILQPGVTVSIGLDKSTKLSAVFDRYCAFCNENSSLKIQTSDLEFVHCTLLNGHDTAESSALMKNDRVKVRKVRTSERAQQDEWNRLQRESDREYFKRLRLLLPDTICAKNCDVVLDCRGKLVDENGLNQEVLRTDVRGHSAILSKRCKWLGRMIQGARDELERRSVVTIPENDGGGAAESDHESSVRDMEEERQARESADDDDFEVVPYPNQRERVLNDDRGRNSGGAAEIENDDDDDDDRSIAQAQRLEPAEDFENRSGSPVISSTSGSSSMLWVVLPNHPPEAVKLLLEYCYTNRVLPLGQDAFMESCRTKPEPHKTNKGPVPPYHSVYHGARRWPNNGLPQVSFPVALAGISLAEEASMSRLSLMCEIAAAQLVTRSNFVEALSLCTTQQQRTGNNLPRLREAAMEVILRHGSQGITTLSRMPTFRRALKDRSAVVVPSLLVGTMHAVKPKSPKNTPPHLSGCKRELKDSTMRSFDSLDRDDAWKREMERRKRRVERRKERGDDVSDGVLIGEDDVAAMMDPYAAALEPSKMSLKRMSHHLGALGRSDNLGYQALLGRRGRSRTGSSKVATRRRSGRNKGV